MPFLKTRFSNQVHPLPEVLLHNIVDKDIQRLLAPMNFMQSIFLLPKYKIRDNFITPNGYWSTLASFFGLCLFIGLYYINTLAAEELVKTSVGFLNPTLLLDFMSFSMGFTINFLVCTLQSKWSVQLVLKLQESHRNLYDTKFQTLVKWNRIFTALLVSFYLLDGICLHLLYHKDISTITLSCTVTVITFDYNMVSVIRLMIFINVMFKLWLKKFRLYLKVTKSRNERFKRRMLWKRMYQTYSSVMESYNLLKKVFQWLILYHVAGTFFHSLLYVQLLIQFTKLPETKRYHKITYVTAVQVHAWLLKNLTLHAALATVFERFYIIQADAEDACSMAEAHCATDPFKKSICKNVRRLKSIEVVKFKLGQLFLVDAKYPLRLLRLIATYTIVLLQFGYQ